MNDWPMKESPKGVDPDQWMRAVAVMAAASVVGNGPSTKVVRAADNLYKYIKNGDSR